MRYITSSLSRAKGSVRFRPYDLVVVQRTKVEAEYFTVSATGVMRLRRGVQVRTEGRCRRQGMQPIIATTLPSSV